MSAPTLAAKGVGSPTSAPRLLLVEDDRALAEMLVELFGAEGYLVDAARDGQSGLHWGLTRDYDVMIVDRGLPAIEGLDLVTRLRSRGVMAPVLILSALGLPRDRVDGLDAGAEDYLSKPFDLDELLARLRALRRRHPETAEVLVLPGARLVLESRTVNLDSGESRSLSDRECSLLEVLSRRPHQVFSRTELMGRVFPEAEDEGVVDTYVHYLRRKLGKNAIRTIRGVGYQLGGR
jgi:two-component system response regulator QseB